MTVSEKLKLIQRLSERTQEELARQLEVSFAALNAWINNRAQPRPDKLRAINGLYIELTGQKVIPEKELTAKKQLIARMTKNIPNIVGLISRSSDIRDQLSLSLTYNTNRIEGSAMTEQDTAAVLFHNTTLSNRTLTEQLEAKNHQTALQFVFDWAQSRDVISEAFVLQLHRILMNGIAPDAGSYRKGSVRIVGANVPTANFLKIPELMRSLLSITSRKKRDIIGLGAEFHARFEQIHPFSDGNGRIGRLLLQAMLLQSNIAPAVIEQQRKTAYYSSLNRAQTKSDFSQLEDFICEAALAGFDIIKRGR